MSSPRSDNAIRHRGPHSHQPSTALNIGGEDSPTASGNDSSKLHRHHHRRVSPRSNKVYMVLGGGLAVFFICIMGLWSSSYYNMNNKDIDNDSPDYSNRRQRNRHGQHGKEDFIIRNNHNRFGNEQVNMQGRKYETNRGQEGKRKNRNRFHDLPILRKNKNVVTDDDDVELDNRIPSLSGSKPRAIYVELELIQKQPSNDDKTDEAEDYNLTRHSKAFRLTKVKPISKVPYSRKEFSRSERVVTPYPDDDYYFENIEKIQKLSKKYSHAMRDSADEQCQFKYDWQEGAFPNCNVIHEFELGQLNRMLGRMARKRLRLREGDGNDLVQYLSHGYWRDVWVLSHRNAPDESHLKEEEELTVLKTLRYEHDFTDRNYDRHRKDALASERLSGSPYVVDIFAFCQNTAVFEYGKGGDIDAKLWPYDEEEEEHLIAELSSWEKLDMAYQVACGIADMHSVEEDGIASIAHTDITPSQFIYIDGKWKVNDFNRCRFMREYKEDKSVCGFEVGSNPGKFRAPEEYAYEVETEKIDVYSMGNVFYAILSGLMPFEGMKQEKAKKNVMEGKRPKIPSEVKESDDIAIQAILSATKKCWRQDPTERPPAAEIRDKLKSVMERIKKENVTKTAED
mmetsp:Transcript_19504/g.28901  ORF Transcript_19504/g.28901 Transcript_19504/m.28901 type:complete len:624 (-) Transcript_19504:40-1911(-)